MAGFVLSQQHIVWSILNDEGAVKRFNGRIDMSPKSGVKGLIDGATIFDILFLKSNTYKLIAGKLDNGCVVLIPDAAIELNMIQARICFVTNEPLDINLNNINEISITKTATHVSGIKSIITFNGNARETSSQPQTPWYKCSNCRDLSVLYAYTDCSTTIEAIRREKENYRIISNEDIVVNFHYPHGINYQELMSSWIAPLQSFASILTQKFESVLRVYVMVAIKDKCFPCTVYGESIVNVDDTAINSSAIKQLTTQEFVERYSIWRKKFSESLPLFDIYGQLMLAEENLSRMRFLLLVESLEGHYDSIHKNEMEKKRTEFKKKYDSASSYLKRLRSNSAEEERHLINFIKDHLYRDIHIPLSQKLTTLFSELPKDTITHIASYETLQKNAKSSEDTQSVDFVCNALSRLRNALSHGSDRAYENDFPLLVNALEGIVQYYMLCEVGFDPKEINRTLCFSGFPPPKRYDLSNSNL